MRVRMTQAKPTALNPTARACAVVRDVKVAPQRGGGCSPAPASSARQRSVSSASHAQRSAGGLLRRGARGPDPAVSPVLDFLAMMVCCAMALGMPLVRQTTDCPSRQAGRCRHAVSYCTTFGAHTEAHDRCATSLQPRRSKPLPECGQALHAMRSTGAHRLGSHGALQSKPAGAMQRLCTPPRTCAASRARQGRAAERTAGGRRRRALGALALA